MKIIHIVLGKANPNRMNGVNKVVHNLATTQVELGHQVQVIGLTNSNENDNFDRSYDLKIFPRKNINLDEKLIKYIKSIDRFTIFHIHGGFILDFYFISKLLYKQNFRYIHTSHGCYNKEAMKKNFLKKYVFFKFFDKYILENAWKVQFLGKSEFIYIDSMVKNINKVIIPNGQDLNELKFEYKNLKDDDDLIFGFVGRIDKFHKGLDLLIEGYKISKKQNILILNTLGMGLNPKPFQWNDCCSMLKILESTTMLNTENKLELHLEKLIELSSNNTYSLNLRISK